MLNRDGRLQSHQTRRIAFLLVIVVTATAATAITPLHRAARSIIASAEPIIQQHATVGAIVFVLVSALSAMFVFFSTAVITPIAVDAFGPFNALLLLWLGWVLGGLAAYAIGRFFGRRVVGWFIDPWHLRDYERRAQRLISFRHLLLFQLAVPSEIPGYVLGLTGCRFRTFIAAMALGELPFAIGTVYMGESFLTRNYVLLFGIGIVGAALSWAVFRRAAAMWSSGGEPRGGSAMSLVIHHRVTEPPTD